MQDGRQRLGRRPLLGVIARELDKGGKTIRGRCRGGGQRGGGGSKLAAALTCPPTPLRTAAASEPNQPTFLSVRFFLL